MATDPHVSTESDPIVYPISHHQVENVHDLLAPHSPNLPYTLGLPLTSVSAASASSSTYARLAIEQFGSASESFEPSPQLGPFRARRYFHTPNAFLDENVWSDLDGPWTAWRPLADPESADFAAFTYAVGPWTADGQTATLSDDTMSIRTDLHSNNIADLSWDATSTTSTSLPSYYSSVMYTPSSYLTIHENDFTSSASPSDQPYIWNEHPESSSDWDHIPYTLRNAELPPTSERKAPSYKCMTPSCPSRFIRHADLVRHLKIHTTQERGQGYRCAFHGCPKAGKIWSRLDSFKKHVYKRHKGTDVKKLVQKSSRVLHGADTNFPFSVSTPASMSQQRLSKGQPRAREAS